MKGIMKASLGLVLVILLMSVAPVLSEVKADPPARRSDPTLSGGGVTPASGDPTKDDFTFFVWYEDPDYDWPNNMTVNIDDIDIPMENITCYNGSLMNFTYTDFNFDSGTHEFYFWCYNDNYTKVIRYPSSGTMEFTVTGDHERPELYSYGISNSDPLVGENVTFYTYYKDAGGDAPDWSIVVINSNYYDLNINGTDYTKGVYCWFNYTIPYRSTYRYSFFANDSSRLYDQTKMESFYIKDRLPVILNGSVYPETGDAQKVMFTFSVWYKDPDGDYPYNNPRVWIENDTYRLYQYSGEGNGSDIKTGVKYAKDIRLFTGTYRYYFYMYFWDQNDTYQEVRDPETGYYTMKAGGNYTPPQLYNGSATPMEGNTSTTFTFNVWYRDADNDPPDFVGAYCEGTGYRQMTVLGTDYRNGTKCTASMNATEPGRFIFFFEGSDSTGLECFFSADCENSTIVIQGVPGTAFLSNGTVDPPAGGINQSFMIEVDYHDMNGRNAREPVVIVDGEIYYMWGDYYLSNNTIHYYTWIEMYGNMSWAGTHTYYFEFLDSQYCNIRYPETGAFSFQVFEHVPRLWNASVTPKAGDDHTSYTFKIRYQDSKGTSPSSVQVIIDGNGYDMSPQSTNYQAGVDCIRTMKLGPGLHKYYFRATIPGGAWTQYPGREKYTIEVDGHNELYDRMVIPFSGHTETDFNFTIKFKDTSGWAPTYVQIFIDNDVYTMDPAGDDLASGVTYYYNTRLGKGNHTYYYIAYNEHGSLRTPGLGEYYKITVLDPPVLHAPFLLNVSYIPISGNSSTVFTFSARYMDLDGDAPGSVQVVIDGTPHNMTLDGTDHINGTNCTYSTKLSVGNHTIHFHANDTTGREVRVPQTESYTLKVEEETGPPPVKHAPVAMISHSISGMNVTLNGSSSYDTDGTISSYMWIVAGEPHTGDTIKVSFSTSGYYKAILTVVDDDGLSDTEMIKFWIYPTTTSIPTPSSDVGGSMVVDKDGKGVVVDNETGFSLKLDSVGNNTVSFNVDSATSGSKMVVLDVSKEVLKVGEDQEVTLKIDGTEVTLASSLEAILGADSSTPLFYMIDTGDSYRIVVYMPNAEDMDLELSVTDSGRIGDIEKETDEIWLFLLLAAVVVILIIIVLMSMARNSGRYEDHEE